MNDYNLKQILKFCATSGIIVSAIGLLVVSFGYYNNSDDIMKIGIGIGIGGAFESGVAAIVGAMFIGGKNVR